MQKRILIADDDPTMRAALDEALRTAGHQVTPCADGEEAGRLIQQGGVDLVVSDVRMPGAGGMELLKRFSGIPFIMISGYATVPEAVEAMKFGAYDFLVKPFSYRELIPLVEHALAGGAEQSGGEPETGDIVTTHPQMLALLRFAAQVAKSQAAVLVTGESGTGKELLARFLHARSRRDGGPFVAINCAALPEGLLESELFGHEKGAFTGAVAAKAGKFELAHKGTLLLDEVSEMPLALQAKLLRVLQEREVDRLGGKRPLAIDARVIATTNRDLREMVRSGAFREDLFYRLNVIPLRLPALRERMQDIEPLARAFFADRGYKKNFLAPEALAELNARSWPGNIRELFNVLERAAILAGEGAVESRHLLLEEDAVAKAFGDFRPAAFGAVPGAEAFLPHRAAAEKIPPGMSVRRMEEKLIFQTLAEVRNNRTEAAKLLGISVRTLRNKLKLYRTRECGMEA
ncbi:MAG TPA: sigma-54 dependent transcriptional regulator [Candidatus Binatia bacterium]